MGEPRQPANETKERDVREERADEARRELDDILPPGTDPLHEGP